MKIKIDKQILWWMKKIRRTGMRDVLLTLTPPGIKVTQADENQSFALQAFLSKKDSSILVYELNEQKELPLPIPDFPIFCNLIETFKDIIDVNMETPQCLRLKSGSKTVHYQLLDIEFIKGAGKTPKGTYGNQLGIEKSVLDSVVKDARLLDAIKIRFSVDKGELGIFVESDSHKTEYHVKTPASFSREAILPKHTLEETVSVLTQDKIELGFHESLNSLRIKETTDDFYVVTTLAGVQQ